MLWEVLRSGRAGVRVAGRELNEERATLSPFLGKRLAFLLWQAVLSPLREKQRFRKRFGGPWVSVSGEFVQSVERARNVLPPGWGVLPGSVYRCCFHWSVWRSEWTLASITLGLR